MLVYIYRDIIQGTYTGRHDAQAYIDITYLHIQKDKIHMYYCREMINRHIYKET